MVDVYSKFCKYRIHGSYVYCLKKNYICISGVLVFIASFTFHLIFHKNNLRQETSPIWQRGNAPIADHVQSCTSEFSLSKSGAIFENIFIPKWYMIWIDMVSMYLQSLLYFYGICRQKGHISHIHYIYGIHSWKATVKRPCICHR